MPNTREIALVVWFVIVLIVAVSRSDLHKSLCDLLRAFFARKLLPAWVLLVVWTITEVVLGARLGLWRPSLAFGTLLWFLTAAIVMMVNSSEAASTPRFLRTKVVEVLRLSVFVEGVASLATGPLWLEFILVPVVVLLGATAAYVDRKPEYLSVKRLLTALLNIFGLALLSYAITSTLRSWDGSSVARQLLLPVWMTIGAIPLIYGVGLLGSYGVLFIRMRFAGREGAASLASKVALVLRFNVQARRLHTATIGASLSDVANARTVRAAHGALRQLEVAKRHADGREQDALDRLDRFAGVDGVDNEGRRLDRREFAETPDALRYLASCEMGWYRQQQRYRPDLLNILDDDFGLQGLAKPSGIEMRVRDDGQAWYAYRRTVSGWYFGIGANEAPPSQWTFDGAAPPLGFPDSDPCWGESAFSEESSPNWS
jgi:hypothetical protein